MESTPREDPAFRAPWKLDSQSSKARVGVTELIKLYTHGVHDGQHQPAIASEERKSSPECGKIVATPCIETPENGPLTAWLDACPANLDDAQRDAIRIVIGE